MKLSIALAAAIFLIALPLVVANGEEKAGGGYQLLVLGILLGFVLGALSSYSYLLRRKVSTEKKSEEISSLPLRG